MLTKVQAIEFLQNSWKVSNVELQIENDREKFLNKLIVTILEKVPFQLLFLAKISLTPPESRKTLSVDEVDEMCMSGQGGNCFVINSFTLRLLRALGYSAYLCRTVVTTNVFNPHLVVIVKDLVEAGDLHLVDCGLGLPSFHAISLNFTKESPIYKDSFLEYKLIKHDGKIFRMHGDGDLMCRNNPPIDNIDFISGKWRRFYEFHIETLECESMNDLGSVYSLRYLPANVEPRAARFPEGKAFLLYSGYILYIEQEDQTLRRITLGSKDEAFQAFKDYFPSISEDLVQLAYSKWPKPKLRLLQKQRVPERQIETLTKTSPEF